MPDVVKSNLGTYAYKSECSSYFYSKCQHPYRKSVKNFEKTCKICDPPDKSSVFYLQKLKERGNVNKYLIPNKYDFCYKIDSFSTVHKQRLLLHHKQADLFRRQNNMNNFDAKKLLKIYKNRILDWYPINMLGQIIGAEVEIELKFNRPIEYEY